MFDDQKVIAIVRSYPDGATLRQILDGHYPGWKKGDRATLHRKLSMLCKYRILEYEEIVNPMRTAMKSVCRCYRVILETTEALGK